MESFDNMDKQEIIKFSRYIIYYCDHGFNLDPHFQDIQELKQIAEYISNYGDIATCRRALKLLSFDKKINPKDTMNSLRINKAKVIVVFD